MAHASKNVENRARKVAVLNCGLFICITKLVNGTEIPFISVGMEKRSTSEVSSFSKNLLPGGMSS